MSAPVNAERQIRLTYWIQAGSLAAAVAAAVLVVVQATFGLNQPWGVAINVAAFVINVLIFATQFKLRARWRSLQRLLKFQQDISGPVHG